MSSWKKWPKNRQERNRIAWARNLGEGCQTPLGQARKASGRSDKGEVVFVGTLKTPVKKEDIFCICGKNRESLAKNKRDWVECEECKRWSHLSCYKIAKGVMEREDVQFVCVFCRMTTVSCQRKETTACRQQQERLAGMEREISELKVKLKESNEQSEKYKAEVTRLSSKVECLDRELKRREERGGELHSTRRGDGTEKHLSQGEPEKPANKVGGVVTSKGSQDTVEGEQMAASARGAVQRDQGKQGQGRSQRTIKSRRQVKGEKARKTVSVRQ